MLSTSVQFGLLLLFFLILISRDDKNYIIIIFVIIIIIKDIYIAQVRKGHKYAMSAEMAVWLRNCLCLHGYL